MKHGEKASGWIVKKLLTSLHRIFDESPSRRADYEALAQAISSRLSTTVLCKSLGRKREGSNESKRDLAQNC